MGTTPIFVSEILLILKMSSQKFSRENETVNFLLLIF